MIPIKRQPWISKIVPANKDRFGRYIVENVRSVPYGYYRHKVWEKKVYEADYDFKKK